MRKLPACLMAATMLTGAAPASAQAADNLSGEIAALRAQIDALQARVAELEGRTAAPTQTAAATAQAQRDATATAGEEEEPRIRFRGAPEISAPGGWSFKPRGRLQYDVAHVSRPEGIDDPGLGFSNEIRRARLGIEGTMPGGFGYTFELDFAEGGAEIIDALISYKASDAISLTLGQHNGFQSLEELTSSRFTSFIERAAFTDAFNFERRLGLSATLTSGDLIVQAGAFSDNVADLDEDGNNGGGVDGRIVFAPELGDTRLHLGASAHWRDNGDLAATTATRYRQRPMVHSTDVRFIGTPALPVEQETSWGVEAAVIHGPFHAVAEGHWLDADPLGPGRGWSFFGAYAEVGWFITGESRGYRSGRFDRTRVRNPVEDGGIGAFQVNLRYDRLDLNSGTILGGTQDGFQASLIWIPTDYVRFLINYGHLSYEGASLPAADGDRDYGVDVVAARAQIDF